LVFILEGKFFQESFEKAFEIIEKEKREIGIYFSLISARRPSLPSLLLGLIGFLTRGPADFPRSRVAGRPNRLPCQAVTSLLRLTR
jgi:hypothetical protein